MITFPALIISCDRYLNSLYIYVDYKRMIKYSFTLGVESIINFIGTEIYINSKRTDGSVLVLTNS